MLDGFAEIKVCIGYELDGKQLDYLPADANEQARLKPVYETLEGWSESTRGARSWAQLPANAIKYVRRVEELIGAPVALLSTSPDRDDTIMVRDPLRRTITPSPFVRSRACYGYFPPCASRRGGERASAQVQER